MTTNNIDIIVERRRVIRTMRRCISAEEWMGKQGGRVIVLVGGKWFWPLAFLLSSLTVVVGLGK